MLTQDWMRELLLKTIIRHSETKTAVFTARCLVRCLSPNEFFSAHVVNNNESFFFIKSAGIVNDGISLTMTAFYAAVYFTKNNSLR